MNEQRVPKKILNITKRSTVVRRKSSKGKTNVIMETKAYKNVNKRKEQGRN